MLDATQATSERPARAVAAGCATLGSYGSAGAGIAEAGTVIAVVDGHVYNREELGVTGTEAEAVIALYRRDGFAGMLRRLNGDFAIALYDAATDTLWLGRDRFGIRPLYYTTTGGGLAFASRPGALLALPGVSRDLNRRFVALFAACHYRYFDNEPGRSPYAAVQQLPAGHVLRVSGATVHLGRYWSLADASEQPLPEADLAEAYRHLLSDAVARRLAVATRPAFTLSGGMDSSSVVALASRIGGGGPDAFSAVYEDATYDESREIGPMLEAVVGRWRPVAIGTPDVFTLVRRMIEVHDEPVATATWLSHFLICQEAARHGFGALFGGLGGDEINAGEYEYFLYHFADLRAAGREEDLQREAAAWIHHHDHPVFRKSVQVMERGLARLVDWQHPGVCRPDRGRLTRYASALEPGFLDLTTFEPVMEHPFGSYLKNRAYQDLVRETTPCCLRAQDRHGAAFGLDHFLPFLDHRVVEFMFGVAGSLKIRAGVTKHLLREAMRGVLPEETRTRVKKTGWNAPAHVWFSGAGREPLLDLVHSSTFRQRGIYRVREVERIVDEHERLVASAAPVENHMMFLWQLVNLELWLQMLEPALTPA
jgi:asparagine synthase (glutamine-hydrolysing)